MNAVKSTLLKTGLLAGLITATAAVPPAADASSIGGIFLYRTRAHVRANCIYRDRQLAILGFVRLRRHRVFAFRYLGQTSGGYIATDKSEYWSATRAVKERWCYRGDFYNEYFAANTFHRYRYVYWWVAGGSAAGFPFATHYTRWYRGL